MAETGLAAGGEEGEEQEEQEALLQTAERLAALLPALLPPRARLARLTLHSAEVRAAELAGCAELASLRALEVLHCTSPDLDAAVEALMTQAPRLTELRLEGCLAGSLPPCVVARRGLRRLSLAANKLQELPPGDYLSGERVQQKQQQQLLRPAAVKVRCGCAWPATTQ